MRTFALILALVPAVAMAQPAPYASGNPMTEPVTPRDVAYYMAHPDVMNATLRVCHSNAAYGPTPDCQNAERAGAGLLARTYARAGANSDAIYQDPAYWSANSANRDGVLAQCRRRGPGDELVFPYCKAAAESAMRSSGARR